jgi:Tol biopolymer transport system component
MIPTTFGGRVVALLSAIVVLGACSTGASAAPGAGGSASHASGAGVIVFYNDPGGSGFKQLYIERADGSGLRQLLRSSFDDVLPTLSPDSTHVVFVRQREHGNLPDQTFVVGVNGTGLHQIVPGGCPAVCGDAVEGHAYSPDGKRIVFTRAVFLHGSPAPAYVELWTSNLDGSHAVRLTHENGHAQDDSASWSPDGRRIVFLHWIYGSPDQFRIATIAADGSDMHLITPPGLDSADPSYSPQGNRIVFQSPPDPVAGVNQILYTVRPDGTALAPLAKNMTGIAANHPSWSPDGTKLVFCHIPYGQASGADLYLINSDGTHLHPLAKTTHLDENGSYWGSASGPHT